MFDFPGVTYHPWVGENYQQSCFGVRLLILGESHWEEREDKRNALMSYASLSDEVVTEYIDGAGYNFFTKIANVLLSRGNHRGR